MKMYAAIAVISCLLALVPFSEAITCKSEEPDIPKEWVTMNATCTNHLKKQIQMEVDASIAYLAMGAYFSRDVVNRPGFAKMFFEAASEERHHGMKLIEYLLMRGELTENVDTLIKVNIPSETTWANGNEALKTALKLETAVTQHINQVIKTCEEAKDNDYHLVDYLSGDFLDEQYKGQKDLAGKASTLSKMMATNGPLGEFLFDKKLLHGELLAN